MSNNQHFRRNLRAFTLYLANPVSKKIIVIYFNNDFIAKNQHSGKKNGTHGSHLGVVISLIGLGGICNSTPNLNYPLLFINLNIIFKRGFDFWKAK